VWKFEISRHSNTKYIKKNVNINPYSSIFKNFNNIKTVNKMSSNLTDIPPRMKVKNFLFDLLWYFSKRTAAAIKLRRFIAPAIKDALKKFFSIEPAINKIERIK
jgi:hypothetical protein